jgi:hypothetical protein
LSLNLTAIQHLTQFYSGWQKNCIIPFAAWNILASSEKTTERKHAEMEQDRGGFWSSSCEDSFSLPQIIPHQGSLLLSAETSSLREGQTSCGGEKSSVRKGVLYGLQGVA